MLSPGHICLAFMTLVKLELHNVALDYTLPCIVLLSFSHVVNLGFYLEAQTFEGTIWNADFFSIPSKDSCMCLLNRSLSP